VARPDPAVLQNHLPAALSIFTWLRQSRAEKAATQWAEMIKPAVEDDKTPPGLKAHFYNTLTVLAQKTANPALAKEAMDQVLENLFNPGEAGMKMLAVTMSNMAQQLNAAGKSEQALELYQRQKSRPCNPRGTLPFWPTLSCKSRRLRPKAATPPKRNSICRKRLHSSNRCRQHRSGKLCCHRFIRNLPPFIWWKKLCPRRRAL
jgi:hypothetical protein